MNLVSKYLSTVVCFALFDFGSLTLLFAQSSDSTKTVRAREVHIEDTRENMPATSLHAYEALSKSELNKLNAISVAEAVKQLPNIMLKDYGGIGGLKTISVRSLGSEHTSVQVDGIKISDGQTGQIDLGRFSIQNLEQVELINGNSPDALSPARAYSAASVLNLVSKVESFHRSNQNYEWRIGAQVGSFGQLNQSAMFYSKLPENISVGMDVERISANGEYDYRLQNGRETLNLTRRNADLQSLRVETDFAISVSKHSNLFIKTYFFNSERGLPNAVAIRPNPDLIEVSKQRLYLQDVFMQMRVQTPIRPNLKINFGAKFAYGYLRFTEPAIDTRNSDIDDRYIQREFYGTMSLAYQISERAIISVASDLALNTLNASLYNAAQPKRWTSISAVSIRRQSAHVSIDGNIVATLVGETTEFGAPAPKRHALTPSLAIGYKPFSEKGFRLRASYRNSFRLPTFNDLYYTRIGNTDLLPEYARQWNFGIGYEKASTSIWQYLAVRIDGFRIDVKDKILAVPRDAFNWTTQNIGAVQTLGVDAHLESSLRVSNTALSLAANYTRQNVIDVSPASQTPNQQIPYAPKEISSILVILEKDFWSIGYALTYTGFRFTLPKNTAENVLPAFWMSDLNISVGFEIGSVSAKIKGEVSNLFNARYEVIQFFPMPARNVRLSFNLTSHSK